MPPLCSATTAVRLQLAAIGATVGTNFKPLYIISAPLTTFPVARTKAPTCKPMPATVSTGAIIPVSGFITPSFQSTAEKAGDAISIAIVVNLFTSSSRSLGSNLLMSRPVSLSITPLAVISTMPRGML